MTILAIVLLALGSFVAVANIAGGIGAMLRMRRGEAGGYSNIHFLSLSFGVLAWWLAPGEWAAWALLPAMLDPANWSLVALPLSLVFRSRDPGETPECEDAATAPRGVAEREPATGPESAGGDAARGDAELRLRATPYEGSTLHVEMHASNGAFAATQDFYCEPDEIRGFGARLLEFPRSPEDEVVWEMGSPDPGWAYHVRLRIYQTDALGHAAMEVLVDNRLGPPRRAVAEFSLRCEPAGLDRLGQSLVTWSRSHSRPLAWRPDA